MIASPAEGPLIDAVLRHELGPIGLTVDDFGAPYTRRVWAAILDLWAADERPSLLRVHCQLVQRGDHVDDSDIVRLYELPLGRLAELEDLVGLVAENSRRNRIELERAAS